ncbi:MAG: hypothetical protein JF587_18025 [Catenulisporales bacterium]|nr:hypothetical protein [Catenulisporales bacterium]
MLTAVAALSLLWGAESSYGAGSRLPLAGVASVIAFVGSIAIVIGATVAKDTRVLIRLDLALLALSLVVLGAWVGSDLLLDTSYRTDEEVFVQYGAHLISQGKNPYGVDMTSAFQMFPLAPQQFTPRLDGSFPTGMGYPALPMLLTWVANLFTGGYHTIIVLNLVAACVSAVLAFLMLPIRFRPLGVLLTVGMPGLVLHVEFGFIQVLMLPFLLAASWNWSETGRAGKLRKSGVARAVCLGLAISIQQLAWFTVPFVLVGLYLLRRGELGRRGTVLTVVRFAAIAAGTFAAVNLPFAVTAPKAWFNGIMEPLTQHAIPLGNGLIGLTEALGIGSGNLSWYSNGALLLLITLLLAYSLYFRVLGSAVFVLPFVGLLFSSRSLAAYFVPLAVLWGVSLLCADREAFAATPRLFDNRFSDRARKLIVTASALPSIALLGLATTASQPLKVAILSTDSIGPLHLVQQMTVKVTNTTDKPVSPHFLTSSSSLFASTFWSQSGGPAALAPHQTATYTLSGTSQAAMAFASSDFKIMAVSDDPAAVSWSPLHKNVPIYAAMDAGPDNAAYPVGTEVTLTVHLRSATTGKDVKKSGVRVVLTQTVYLPGITPGPATINGKPKQDPAIATTNADGMATFVVHCDTPQTLPVMFQAQVANGNLSYSSIVPIIWR